MFRYECCFSSGRQFVFTERKGWPIGERQLALCLASLLAGVYLFFFISFAGVAAFEVVMLCLASCAARSAYVWSFHGSSNTVDHLVYVVMVGIFTGVLLVFLSSVRLLLSLETSAANRCMLFSVSIMIMGFLTYSYLTIACSEDERKHQIRPCTQEGCTLQTMELSCHGEGPKDNGRDVYGRFLKWIVSWRWWTDVQDHSATAEDERRQSDAITVHNHSLKLIKVCFYSPADLVCWVPFGGVSGRCVGLVDAGRSRSFHFPRADGDDGGGPYRLKVFQPRLLDKELACFPQAQRGQNLAFFDVEGTVRRSRLLSNSTCRSLSISTCLPESSEDEAAPTSPGTPTTAGSPGSDDASAGRPTPAQAKHGSTSDLGPPRRGDRGEAASSSARPRATTWEAAPSGAKSRGTTWEAAPSDARSRGTAWETAPSSASPRGTTWGSSPWRGRARTTTPEHPPRRLPGRSSAEPGRTRSSSATAAARRSARACSGRTTTATSCPSSASSPRAATPYSPTASAASIHRPRPTGTSP
ncbi:unnamed protein product [Prorocentrum cordatum]|uniref:Uncharacterized protein n=1 Tax=Prorocentrum cordatum TaxID=2364126 RepID=A0ABN9U6L4_9DINO|nr:unnamed protein product [Polarella glacialis]